MKKTLRLAVLGVSLLTAAAAFAAPARLEAGDASINVAVALGNENSRAIDIYLKKGFDSWWSPGSFELRPQIYGGLGVWSKQGHYEPPRDQRHRSWSRRNFAVYGAVGLEMEYVGEWFRPYLGLYVGPSYINDIHFVGRELGAHVLIHSRGDLGLRFGENFRHHFGLELTHYSNARTNKKNDGLNNVGLTYGISF